LEMPKPPEEAGGSSSSGGGYSSGGNSCSSGTTGNSSSSEAFSSSSDVLSSGSVTSSGSAEASSSSSDGQGDSSSSGGNSSSGSVEVSSSSSEEQEGSSSSNLCAGFTDGTESFHLDRDKPQFCDSRDGKKYFYVEIDTQTWMAENLNYAAEGSKCGNGFQGSPLSDEDNANCDKYGRLYDWATAMDIDTKYNSELWNGSDVKHQGVCPSGWHLPNQAELDVLLKYADPSFVSDYVNIAGTKLKTASDWNSYSSSSGNGEDAHGFSALPGGVGYNNTNVYSDVNVCGFWWGTTEAINVSYAYHLSMIFLEYAFFSQAQKNRLESVRCVKNTD
jgi:uncharacterized protein (TIGR02145 family)